MPLLTLCRQYSKNTPTPTPGDSVCVWGGAVLALSDYINDDTQHFNI